MTKIQDKVSSTILQTPFKITLGGVEYIVPSPTIGTIILMSQRMDRIGEISIDDDNVVASYIRDASKCAKLGEMIAIMIIGGKALHQADINARKSRLWPFRRKDSERLINELSDKITFSCSYHDLNVAFGEIISHFDITDFFEITTFLRGLYMTKPTKVVETTASGQ